MDTQVPDRTVKIVLGILIAAFLFLCLLFVQEYSRLARLQLVGMHRVTFSPLPRRPLTGADVQNIQSWMTFEYINAAFSLPAGSLQSKLHVSDPRYPRISLSRAAHEEGTSTALFVGTVENSVREILTSQK